MADREVRFNHTARDDLRQLILYLVESGASIRIARDFAGRIEAQCHKLSYFPHRGLQQNDIRPGLRLLSVERRSVIAYVIEDETIVVTNIFHAGQDFEALLTEQ